MIIYLPLLVSLVGLLMFALAGNPKVSAIGKDMFWVGLLVFLAQSPHLLAVKP